MPYLLLQLRRSRWLRFLLIGSLSLILCFSAGRSGLAQFVLPSPSTSVSSVNQPPAKVERLGNLEVTILSVDNTPLFKIASPTVRDRSNPGKLIPVEVRREQIEANLAWVIRERSESLGNNAPAAESDYTTNFDPRSLKVTIAKLNGETILLASDQYRAQPLELMTVTQNDAEFYGSPIALIAEDWREKTQAALTKKLQERLPAATEQNTTYALTIAGVTLVLSGILWFLGWLLRRQEKRLKEQETQEIALTDAASGVVEVGRRMEFLALLRQHFTLKRQLSLNGFLQWLVIWGQVILWFFGVVGALFLFPASRGVALQVLAIPIQLLLIFFLVGLANRIGSLLIERFFQAWEDTQLLGFSSGLSDDAQRRSLRLSTIEQAVKGLKTSIVWFIGITTALQSVGVPIGSVLAGGAIVAFAVSFGFQSLVKDLVNGCLILWEDQYGIGDVVQIGQASGVVETMNLRITQIRNREGRLITIPNNLVTQVENLTRRWSRVDFKIQVAYETDVNQALAILQDTGQQLYNDPNWRDRLLEAPEVLGVEDLSHMGMLLRVWIRTKPGDQDLVGREYRRRLRLALDDVHIQIGVPKQETTYQEIVPPQEEGNNHEFRLPE